MSARSIEPTLIVLAGGASQRMGRSKALLAFRGCTWIEAQLEVFARAGGRHAVVVIAERAARSTAWIADALARRTDVCGLSVRAVIQPHPDAPAFSSLRLALDAIGSRPAFVLPIDVPARGATWRALADAIGAHDAAVPTYRGRRGHPVLVSAALATRLIRLDPADPDSRLDRQLARADVIEVALDEPTVVMNLNTPEEWSSWLASEE